MVGVWHGAEWRYIVYGIYNGLIIAFSGLMADTYRTWKKKLHINDKAVWYHIFCVVRTFLLVNISWFFDRAESVGDAFRMMGYAVTQFDPSQLLTITTGAGGTVQTITVLCILGAGCLVLFVVGLLQERGISIRERIAASPAGVPFCNLSWAASCSRIFGLDCFRARIHLRPVLGKEEQTIWKIISKIRWKTIRTGKGNL